MLDFNNILATPGADIKYYEAPAQTNLLQWEMWQKPRGARWIYMLGVGGAGGGGCGLTAGGGGGSGGSSGAQAIVMIPAMFVPDTLFIQCGPGGLGGTTSGAVATAGTNTYVAISPSTGAGLALADTFLRADGAAVGTAAATSTAGGTATNGAATPVIGNMPLAGRGFVSLVGGQAGGAGGYPGAGANVSVPTTGLIVTAGTGGGGTGGAATGGNGGDITAIAGVLGNEFFQLPISGGVGATTGVNGTPGSAGFKSRLYNFGGTGGGACSGNPNGAAAAGGNGAPGCGGGGGGSPGSANPTVAAGGNGGPGFVYIITI